MSNRSPLMLALAPVILAGAALTAFAQTSAPASGQAPVTKDKAAYAEAFARVDVNDDAELSQEEVARLPAIASRFDELDKNKDSVLSVDEFSASGAASTNPAQR